jgi:hypothetical protein
MRYAAANIATGKVISTAPLAAAVTASLRLAYLIHYLFYNIHRIQLLIYADDSPQGCGSPITALRTITYWIGSVLYVSS